jgi:hypothetical protein
MKVAYSTFTILLPTKVVVRKVSGLRVKNSIEFDKKLFFRDATSSFSLLAVTNAISEPEKKPLSNTVSKIKISSTI